MDKLIINKNNENVNDLYVLMYNILIFTLKIVFDIFKIIESLINILTLTLVDFRFSIFVAEIISKVRFKYKIKLKKIKTSEDE